MSTNQLSPVNSTQSSYLSVSNFMVSSWRTPRGRGAFRDPWEDRLRPFEQAKELILRIGNPFALAFGMFGNFMVIVIMFRFPASTFGVFFQVLACSDQLLLLLDVLASFLHTEFGVPYMETTSTWPCKLNTFFFHVAVAVSPWMLVALTMLRAASVLWPHRVNAVWTKGMSRATAGIMIVVILLVNAHFLYGFRVLIGGECPGRCCAAVVSDKYRRFMDKVWSWIDMAANCFVPFILLVVSNSVLLWTLVRSARTSRQLAAQRTSLEARERRLSTLTVTLIATSVSFFVLTSPITIHAIVYPYLLFRDPILMGGYEVFASLCSFLWNVNSAVNFYLYCLTGGKFRAEFWNIVLAFFGLFFKTRKAVQVTGAIDDKDVSQ